MAEGSDVLTFHPSAMWTPETRYDVSSLHGELNLDFSFVTGPRFVLTAGWGSSGTGLSDFRVPYGSEVDDQWGILYITDCSKHRIQVFGLGGEFIRAWGVRGDGPREFNTPADVKIDSKGNVYVVEERNHRVQVFTPEGVHLRSFETFGTGPGEFNNPLGIAFDSQDNIYISDYGNHRVQKLDVYGNFLSEWGGEGRKPGQFNGPYYVETDASDNLYVVDRGNHRVQKFTAEGESLGIWGAAGGDGSPGDGPGEFNWPHEIAIDDDGRVYVADTYNQRVQVFTSDGEYLYSLGDQATFSSPKTVAVDAEFNVYVSDNLLLLGTYVTRWTANLSYRDTRPVSITFPGDFPQTLTGFGVYDEFPRPGVLSKNSTLHRYEPAWELWSNGAIKVRDMQLPPGERITVLPDGSLDFPEGTRFFKTFSYLSEESPEVPLPVETRVIQLRDGRWEAAAYRWKDDRADAELLEDAPFLRDFELFEGPPFLRDVGLRDATLLEGQIALPVRIAPADDVAFDHLIPSRGQCGACHDSNSTFPIGVSLLQLSGEKEDSGVRWIDDWLERGLIQGPIPDVLKVDQGDAVKTSIAVYVQGNCVHCHNGAKVFSLAPNAFRNIESLSIRGVPLVVPGEPDSSLLYRVMLEGAMPPLGVQVLDHVAISRMRWWIENLE